MWKWSGLINTRNLHSITGYSTLLIGLLLCTIEVSQLSAEEFFWSGPGVVLLNNGNVLIGQDVQPQGTNIVIRIDETAQVQVHSDQVVKIATQISELYLHQVASTRQWGAGDHFQLAKWCLRHGLVNEASQHYEVLKELSGNHPKFRVFEAELKQVLLQDPVMQAALKAAGSFPSGDTAETPNSETTADSNKQVIAPETSETELSLVALAKSPVHQTYFRQQLLPFLTMRCGQAGCHGPLGKTDFQIGKGGSIRGRQASDVSLESVVKYLNAQKTEDSTLWIKATTRHGTQPIVSLSIDKPAERELLQRLKSWHQSLYGFVGTEKVAQVPAPFSPQVMPRKLDSTVVDAEQVQPTQAIPKKEVESDLLMLEREIAKLEEKELARKSPQNRHDPEEFNRLYR